jgi:hypothetical protein
MRPIDEQPMNTAMTMFRKKKRKPRHKARTYLKPWSFVSERVIPKPLAKLQPALRNSRNGSNPGLFILPQSKTTNAGRKAQSSQRNR